MNRRVSTTTMIHSDWHYGCITTIATRSRVVRIVVHRRHYDGRVSFKHVLESRSR